MSKLKGRRIIIIKNFFRLKKKRGSGQTFGPNRRRIDVFGARPKHLAFFFLFSKEQITWHPSIFFEKKYINETLYAISYPNHQVVGKSSWCVFTFKILFFKICHKNT